MIKREDIESLLKDLEQQELNTLAALNQIKGAKQLAQHLLSQKEMTVEELEQAVGGKVESINEVNP